MLLNYSPLDLLLNDRNLCYMKGNYSLKLPVKIKLKTIHKSLQNVSLTLIEGIGLLTTLELTCL